MWASVTHVFVYKHEQYSKVRCKLLRERYMEVHSPCSKEAMEYIQCCWALTT
jgi:uncharacterized metal-binding protein